MFSYNETNGKGWFKSNTLHLIPCFHVADYFVPFIQLHKLSNAVTAQILIYKKIIRYFFPSIMKLTKYGASGLSPAAPVHSRNVVMFNFFIHERLFWNTAGR